MTDHNRAELAAGLASTPGYRYAQMVGDRLYVAGQVPLDARGEIVGADPDVHARTCLDNLAVVLDVHGFSVPDLRHLRLYVVGEHQNLLDAWEAVVGWFGGEVPPATLLGVNRLGYAGQLVEVDATVERLG